MQRNTTNRANYLQYVKSLLPNKPTCVEVGVHTGEFSYQILHELTPLKLYLIDPWTVGSDKNSTLTEYPNWGLPTAYSQENEFEFVKNRFAEQITDNTVAVKRGFSYDIVDEFKDNYFDFVLFHYINHFFTYYFKIKLTFYVIFLLNFDSFHHF